MSYNQHSKSGSQMTQEMEECWKKWEVGGTNWTKTDQGTVIVKEAAAEETKRLFSGTGVQITTEGKRLLGATIGNNDFEKKFTKTIISPSFNKYPGWLR